ncbi:MAG: aldo/keto reductase [Flavobacterium sp.]|uniref:aldo/keto reductase n=1 Tax=Flavobacterium sp. TaxID=239 RepID=UPI0022CA1C8E|nr:aldo/keto reductase [Flavobacterium sp.]MCZ8198784.1 aldo/keto reductase [Flavobacterium sp.]
MENNNSRRNFISQTILASAGLLVGQTLLSSCKSINSTTKNQNNPTNNKRKLGNLEVSAIGLGGLPVVGFYGGGVREQSFVNQLYAKAYDNGITFFDTAEVYGPFTNETQIGEAVKSFRKDIVLATKFGFEVNPNHQNGRGRQLNSSPENIRRAVEGSLKRLNTDYIDLYYQHRVDPNVPIEDVAGTIKDLVKEGKVLNWGLSEPGLKTIRRAHAVLPLSAIQNEYSLWTRDYETTTIPLCEELGIGFVPWCPMGYGFFGGSINENSKFGQGDFRAILPRVTNSENLKQNMKLLEFVKQWGNRKNMTTAQIALTWLQAQKPWIVPIPGTSNIEHLIENIKSNSFTFTNDELTEFNLGLSKIEIAGPKNTQQIIDAMGVESVLK